MSAIFQGLITQGSEDKIKTFSNIQKHRSLPFPCPLRKKKMFSSTTGGIQLWIRYYLCSGYACISVSKSEVQLPAAQKPIRRPVKVTQSCPTLCNSWIIESMEFFRPSILEWVAVPFFRGSSQPRDQTYVSRIAGGFFTSWATREAHFKETED